jgi:hypothetical protein
MDPEPVLIFDNFDLDLVIKVLSHTLFSTVSPHSSCCSTLTTGRSVLRRARACLLFLPRSRADRNSHNISYCIPHCYLSFL